MDNILLFFTIAGSIGLFLYGMKLLSEALQKITGEGIRKVFSSMTSNQIRNVITGMFVSGLFLSSSAATVMVVSFVNAGILKLVEAVGVIMGANVGATITAWIIAILGFKLNSSIVALPLIGISFPFLFSASRKVKNWGEIVMGFALIFISLMFLKQSIPTHYDNWLSQLITNIDQLGFSAVLISVIAGILLTTLLRSSSAIFALTVVLALQGWISFELAAAMILGENIGTTVSTVWASRLANVNAKRTALAHLLFNVIGVFWVLTIFPYTIKGVIWICEMVGVENPATSATGVPIALALFHTAFNFVNTIVLVGFSRQITTMVVKRFPVNASSDKEFKLTHIKIGLLSTPEASLFQALRETVVFAENVRKMYINVEHLLLEKDEKKHHDLKEKIESAEEFSDHIEKEIAIYLAKVGQGRLSESSSNRLRALFKMIDEMESIADSCSNIMKAIERKRNLKIEFSEPINNNVNLMFSMVRESLDLMVTMLTYENEVPLSSAQDTEREINNFRDILKSEHLDNLEKGVYKYEAGIIYNDIISQCERIGDYAINIDESFKNLFR
jgi:phosphate:Na+ symporter